jgi:5-methyltetrahydrofolate--homocysteine methyltransferase
MDWKEFYDIARNGIAISDGAMGTLLQSKGLTGEMCPELWNIERPEEIIAIQKAYVEAGAQMLTTNSLGGNRIKLANYGLEKRVAEINAAAIKVSKKAAGGKAIVTASIGPTGKFIEPIGPMTFEEMVEVYKEQSLRWLKPARDALNFETHVDILELKAAIIAAKEFCDLPIIANVTFEKDGRTVTGTPPEAAFTTLEALGADIEARIAQRVQPRWRISSKGCARCSISRSSRRRTPEFLIYTRAGRYSTSCPMDLR